MMIKCELKVRIWCYSTYSIIVGISETESFISVPLTVHELRQSCFSHFSAF